MTLVDVYPVNLAVAHMLYRLMEERPAYANISHKRLPTWDEHMEFILSYPYAHWYAINVDGSWVGGIYLTHQREIGIFIRRQHQGKGYAKQAIRMLMEMHPGKFLANIAPGNDRSKALFRALGFSGPIQETFVHA